MKRLIILTLGCLLALTNLAAAQGTYTRADAETAYLGIQSDNISEAKAKALGFDNPHGSYVTRVVSNSAAEKAGLQPFDYVYGIDEHRVSEDTELGDILAKFKPGDKVTIHFIRQNKKQTVEVTFVSRRTPLMSAAEKPYLGVSPHSDNDDQLGVKVYVVRNSTAEALGMQDGDVILSINNHPMVDWSDISLAIDQLKAGEKIAVEFERGGKKMRAERPIQSYAERTPPTPRAPNWNPDEMAFLGINSTDVSEEKVKQLGFDNTNGSYVTRVFANSAAEKAGLKPFDYVYGINDYRTNEDVSLSKIMRKFKTGDQVTLHYIRNGQKKTADVTFSKRSEAKTNISEKPCDAPFLGVREAEETTKNGVKIEVIEKSTAAEMSLQNGDVITAINGHRILDWEDVSIAVDVLRVGDPIAVEYLRDGEKQTATKPVKSYCETRPEESRLGIFFEMDPDDDRPQPDENYVRVDAGSAIVDLKDMTGEEATDLKNRFNIEMPATNDLRIEKLSVTPDTERNAFRLQFNLPQEGETGIRLYNAAGRMIYNYDLGKFSGDFTDQVNISQNGAGSYFLEIRQGTKAATKKVILQSK
jgi:S1-C subfamily serine protease